MNKTIMFEMATGEKIGLTLSFSLLYKLREKRAEDYERYNKIVMDGIKDMLDYPTALYTAYLCKCIEEEKEPEMSEVEFREKLPYAMQEIVNAYSELYNSKKKLHLEDHLKAEQGR